MWEAEHVPVLPEAVLEYLDPRPGETYVDGTVGGGGHSELILEHSGPDSRLIGLDRDPAQLALAGARLARFGERVRLVRARYEDVLDVLSDLHLDSIAGMLIDCGPSRDQLTGRTTGRGRGFSWHAADEPLEMAYDPDEPRTARVILAEADEAELREIFGTTLRGGEARRVVGAILRERRERPIETTGQFTELVRRALGTRGPAAEKRIPVAYLALRIAVNDELNGLRRGIDAAVEALRPGGRLVVVTFHSLEHRIARTRLRERSGGYAGPPRLIGAPEREARVEVLTSRPLFPSEEEIAANPAARSARLHAAVKL